MIRPEKAVQELDDLTDDARKKLDEIGDWSTRVRTLREGIEGIIGSGTDDGNLDPWHDIRASLLLLEQHADNFTENVDEIIVLLEEISSEMGE